MKRFLIITLAVLIVSALIFGGCAAPAAAPATPGPAAKPSSAQPIGQMAISFGTTHPSSSSYAIGIAVCRMIQKYNPTITATTETAGGAAALLALLKTKEIELGFANNMDMYDAYRGTGLSKDIGKLPVRTLWTGHKLLYQWITVNAKIKELKDLKGAVIWWKELSGAPHMALGQATIDYCIETYGWKPTDITSADRRSTDGAMNAVADGTADVASSLATGGAAVMALAVKFPDRFTVIPYHEEARNYILKKWPMFHKDVVPVGLYQGLPKQEVPVLGSLTYEFVHSDLPDNLVYAICKAVWDHIDEFQSIAGPTGKEYTLKNAVFNPVAPFHNGAIQYYKEKGVWTPELEKKQQELLAEVK